MKPGQEGLLFPDTPPDDDIRRVVAAIEEMRRAGPPEAKPGPKITRTRYGLIVEVDPSTWMLKVKVPRLHPRFPGDNDGVTFTFPLFQMFAHPNIEFIEVFALWFRFFMAGLKDEPDSIPNREMFYNLIEIANPDTVFCTVLPKDRPPKPGSHIWVFSIREQYLHEGGIYKTLNWIVRELEQKGPDALTWKVSLLSHQTVDDKLSMAIEHLIDAGATQETLPDAIGELVKWYYFAAQAFLWIYFDMLPQASYSASLAHPPDLSTVWAFWEWFEVHGGKPLVNMAGLQGGVNGQT